MASNPQTTPDTSHPAMSVSQQHAANILRALDISSHELAYLEKHLMNNDCIPNSADEVAINDAVFEFCESFHGAGRYEFPERVSRLNFLFRAYSNDEELFDPDAYADFQEARDRRLSCETTKYHGVRFLTTDLACCKNSVINHTARAILQVMGRYR